ncbi:MAG: hypothetical protein CNE97_02875 [alpha proteobacterium MED-G10]|nr:MAG: hypothetical protein CNE97_02875 [alpha proteobacterium MED-G10]|tara:strand:+ start:9707 stop:10534 length:828 start_codon:yes stop_codon:yes gene_type:complete
MAHILQKNKIMYNISCIHPTCRPRLARQTRDKWLNYARNPEKIEYITYFDSFDQKELRKKISKKGNIIEVYSPYSFGIVKKCNAAAKLATAKCIVVATDDTIPEIDWDEKLIESADWNKEVVLNTMDGTEKFDKRAYMVKTVILSKKRYNKLGYVLHPNFKHVYCDNFHTWISHKDDVVIQRKNIMFEHLHPSIGKSEADQFYVNASTQEEYDYGSKVFHNLIKENFNKFEEKKLFKKYLNESDPQKKYILAYVLITAGVDQAKLINNSQISAKI